jgi:predicted secreted Zn-dependent protease
LIIEGRMRSQGRTTDVTTTVDLLDYREVSGMLHPFRSVVKIEGLGQTADPETRKQLEEMKKQLAEMPEAQRKMVEEMLKSQMGGGMNIELVVQELRVNQGARD